MILQSSLCGKKLGLNRYAGFLNVVSDGIIVCDLHNICGKYFYFSYSLNYIFVFRKRNIFPTLDSDKELHDGMLYKNLPICNVRVSHNNTIFTLTDAEGTVKLHRSCGMEGFKNTKKGTNIAAQTTAISIATVSIYL